MKTVHQHIREHLLRSLGVDKKQRLAPLEELRKTEWSERFEKLLRNRLILGAARYGRLKAAGKEQYDRIASMINRLLLYKESGNDELLVDVAALCLLEFEEGCHPKKHFKAINKDNDEWHVEKVS